MTKPETRPSILVAEDDPAIRNLLEHLLDTCGCSLVFATDGAEAIMQWRSREFDLILMDIRMPYVDGCTAAQAIRREERSEGRKRVPVIAITAAMDDLTSCDIDEVLMKPFTRQAICDAVIRNVSGHADSVGQLN
ncbi:MAG: response regulator [Desulfuromonadales bacterium]|nr:response regulator [Desulfuromonadales bacterium]